MTERLYYTNSFLLEFEAGVTAVREVNGRTAMVLDRTAFYPTSGGQVFDTGWIQAGEVKLRVSEVAEDESGEVLHFVDGADEKQILRCAQDDSLQNGKPSGQGGRGQVIHGVVDAGRRRDHMQQHSGQHVLSAAFVQRFGMATVSFHMGDESCTIDLDAKSLSDEQVREAEQLANQVVFEDRPVQIRFASVKEARGMGVRKIPPDVEGDLRLIDIEHFDLNACGGTHVSRTGQIGPILLRKTEKVKQGVRVEFVCGERAVRTARADFESLTEAAAVYSAHMRTVPEQIRKSLDEIKAAQKERKRLLEELAELHAGKLLAESAEQGGVLLVTRVFADRDAAFIKLVAQKVVAGASGTIVLLGATGGAQPALVFAQSTGGAADMGALMKDAMAALGGRGGGNRDLAQGGAPAGAEIEGFLREMAAKVRGGKA